MLASFYGSQVGDETYSLRANQLLGYNIELKECQTRKNKQTKESLDAVPFVAISLLLFFFQYQSAIFILCIIFKKTMHSLLLRRVSLPLL